MRILVACEFSGIVRDAFLARGHDALSCDLLPTERPGPHFQGDVLDILDDRWDLMIAHPPCTYLSRAGARWWNKPGREEKGREALAFVMALSSAPISRIAIENPIGRLNQWWRYPDQIIQPYQFGHPYSKATCLWLKNLPLLLYTCLCDEWIPLLPSNTGTGKRSGQRWHRGIIRNAHEASRSFPNIAEAIAEQWGGPVLAPYQLPIEIAEHHAPRR